MAKRRKTIDRAKSLLRAVVLSLLERDFVNGFHRFFYYSDKTWRDSFWLGAQVLKCPFDLWIYQEILFELRPDVIIESGTALGGSALFLASICDLVGNGKVITIDIASREGRPTHERITYLVGSSTSKHTVEQVRKLVADKGKVLVILDSDHEKEHVLQELRIYSRFVSKGSYIVVEDTNINGHPVDPTFGPGPREAVQQFLKDDGNFKVDKTREKYHLSFNEGGYLKRMGPS
jgi:cephalosporin hydroxylase